MQHLKLGLLGGGNMAQAIVEGVLNAGILSPDRVRCVDVDAARRALLHERYSIEVTTDAGSLIDWADCVVLAVKHQVLRAAVTPHRGAFGADKLVLSICAGVSLAALVAYVGPLARVVRAMPNTPALVGAGATAITPAANCGPRDVETALTLFGSVGECVVVAESFMDAVTGLSGSGPAYVMLMIEALADGGVRAGLPRDVALKLAAQTVFGSAKLVLETGEHPAQLKDRVTSPGGTTIAGVYALERAGLRYALMDAVAEATARSRVLGERADG